jgi:hypothetical protein
LKESSTSVAAELVSYLVIVDLCAVVAKARTLPQLSQVVKFDIRLLHRTTSAPRIQASQYNSVDTFNDPGPTKETEY